MRKTMICAFTAAAALAVTVVQPMTAHAAGWTYGMPGNCQAKIMIGEAKGLNVQELLGNAAQNCDVQELLGNAAQNCDMQELLGNATQNCRIQELLGGGSRKCDVHGSGNLGNGRTCELQNETAVWVSMIP